MMRRLLALASCLAASAKLAGASDPQAVLLDNAQVRVFRASTSRAIAAHPAAVVVPLEDGASRKAGEAYWSGDPAAGPKQGPGDEALFIIIEPKDPSSSHPPPPEPSSGPGQGVFTGDVSESGGAGRANGGSRLSDTSGMSFKPLFENDRVVVIRGRMEVGAREGFHTHASDIVLVHLSGGLIEDTASGQTKINRWKHGDVEFEARGSSHSARNLGPAVDAVLVTLKP